MSHLITPTEALRGDLWWALRDDLKLAGSRLPDETFDYEELQDQGLTHVVSLTGERGPDPLSLTSIVLELQDLHGGIEPDDPQTELARVSHAVATVRSLLDDGHGVLVHCLGGTGRTGTVIGGVLVSYGHSVDDVATWLDEIHQLRGNPAWPEAPWQRRALHPSGQAPIL